MTHNMTEMIVTERNTYRKTESAHCHTENKEMATCRHTLGRLMSKLRSSLGAAKEQLRSRQDYAYTHCTGSQISCAISSKKGTYVRELTKPASLVHDNMFIGHRTYILPKALFLTVLMMVLGVTSAWADGYEGTYLIKSASANKKTAGDYYICPTEGWIYYTGTNSFTETDNGQPFLTTYQCKTGGYDVRKAVWKIEKSGEYYTIKHVIDGKYMVYNGQISNANAGRIRIHLEDVVTPGENELFRIGTNSAGKIAISPYGVSNYFNVCQGNINSLAGSTEYNKKAKNDGPTSPTNHKNDIHGTIGLWSDINDENAPFELEAAVVCETPTITYNESTHEISMSTTTDGATIYYTTDGTEPTSSSTSYNGTFTVSSTTNIKAIAVKAGNINSLTASKHVVKYTYIIVNSSGNIAIQYTTPYPVAAGTPLSGYSSIPDDIKSPYIIDESITFKSFDGPFSAAALEAADAITKTPTTENIYITYTTGKLGQKLLHLQGVRPFNLKNGSSQYFVNSSGTTLSFDEVNTDTTPNNQNKNKDHIWYISGGDPYAVTITCPATGNYLTSTPSVTNTENTFFIKAEAGTTVTFQDALGSVAVTYNEVNIPTSYYLIDKAGKRLLGPEESTSSAMAIPSEWKSPLATTYHYWKSSSFDESDGVYTLKAEQTELSGLEDLGEGDHIYITYDVKNDIDIQGGKTYLMKFSGGVPFKQEDENEGVCDTPTQPMYPYNNGDFNLFVYGYDDEGKDKFEKQMSSGASTRSRWLWYLVSNQNGTDLTGDAIDPYHIIVKSRQNHAYKVGDNSYPGNAYFHTFKLNDDYVTGVITQHDVVKVQSPELKPTEYMLLGSDLNHMILKTVDVIEGERRKVDKFEQYWKNNPTAYNILKDAGKTVTEGKSVDQDLSDDQKGVLTALGWHVYDSWANAADWSSNDKATKHFGVGKHWFQTVNMGSGEFSVSEQLLEPEVILLDQHGWEIVRIPMSQKAKLKQYDSPMVETYHWYPTATKVTGYHKYTVSNQEITVYDADGKAVTVEPLTYTHNSTSLADIPYDHAPINNQIAKVKTDFYVTYTVKSDYAGTYVGAATEGAVKASSFFVKQGGKYAQNSSNTIALVDKPALTGEIPTNVQWKVKPNFNIDQEMGYQYDVEEKTVDGETKVLNQSEKEALNNKEERNGFDPYNVQIQSVSNTARYFTVNTGSTVLDHGIWTGSYTESPTVSLREMTVGHIPADGYDQRKLDITNATFMVVDDGNGNMRLMPRFDNTKVMTSFTGLSDQLAPAAVGDDGEGTQSLLIELVPTVITSTDDIISMRGYYILSEDFNLKTSIGTSSNPFEGILDGQLNHYTFDKPIVLYANNATIRNIILDNIGNLTSGNTEHHLGAIACTAKGNTHIYNCGILAGSLSETGHVGGIVGMLDDYSRVINCYSYANIAGGADVGGIVGHNDYASTASDLQTMVMNCAFYGDITGGGTKSPVYGGYNIANTGGGLNNYNYYAYAQLPSDHLTNDKYNTALAVADEDFQRFEFYRLLLNSNRRLAAYYITGRATDADIMAKWVLETADRSITSPATPKAYPVLKEQNYYPSIINYDVSENVPDSASVGRNKGGKLGKTLTVHISGTGITTTSLTIERTDKDFDRYNFNYDKIQLPYFNDVGTGNYTNNQVVTGWEITSMTGGTTGTYSAADEFGGYNFADRNCTSKDLVGTSGRIFSQGAYFDVPYGVTDIYIQPHWATAAYVADEYLDVVYTSTYAKHPVTELGDSFKQFPTGKITINGSEQVVHKTISSAINTFSKGSVYDYAVVLVGNLHQDNVPLNTDAKRFTMMSVDLDNDNEPDYSMIYHHTNRTSICPIRFDFFNVIGTAYAQKPNGATLLKNTTIFRTRGWFEVTNTALLYSNQMEYENLQDNTKEDAPLILLGGKFDQFVSTQSSEVKGKTIYIHVGGNVWIDQFGLGTHSDGSKSTPHVPVSVTGGEYKGFYLTGTYNQDAEVRTDDAECYISGGHFEEAAGACQEAINGNVRWQIYNADIDNFYGGGINNAKPITGNITTEIFNSYVTTFCGGPKFGDMQTGKDVRTTATGCVFEKYFGAGFGGTSYSRKKYHDNTSYNFTNLAKYYKDGDNGDRGKYFDGATTNSKNGGGNDAQYGKKGIGVATDFDYEFFVWSTGQRGARFFVKFASFSLANCIDVYSTLNNCIINQNFYGGGSFGSVSGTATSVLNSCTVHGNVFGGGYSATREKVPVRNAGFTKNPNYNSNTGMFEPGTFSGTTEYEWKQHALPANGTTGIEDAAGDKHYIYTDVDLDQLGKVGNTVLTIQGETVVEGKIFQYDSNGKVIKDGAGNNVVLETSGGVFGGGDESAVNHSTQVTVEETVVDEVHKKPVVLNVFGGGNTADVVENTVVSITGGTIGNGDASDTNGNVYGGGKGQTTVVGGNVTVNLGTKSGESAPFTYTGDGLVKHNVYGGSALGSVNTTPNASSEYDKTTTVNIYAGTVNGNAFGGGLGKKAVAEPATPAIVAKNFGVTTVNMEGGLVKTAVYGGANVNGVLKGAVNVNMLGGTVNATPDPASNIQNVVFGGGYGEPTIVEGNIAVTIGTQAATPDNSKPTVYGNVYGGSALGKVQVSEAGVDQLSNKIDINLYGGTIYGNVFGGGLGQKAAEAVAPDPEHGIEAKDAVAAVEAKVGGNVNVLLDGAKLNCTFTGTGDNRMPLSGQIFGANNLNGTPKGHVKVWVKRTVGTDKSSEAALAKTRDQRGGLEPYSYDVAAVYGGGNQADYIPVDPTPETPLNDTEDYAEVIIEGCELTSIEYVYGGGNAAAVPATDVTILGSYIIDYVFGGGNGKSTATFTNPGANVGSYKNGATGYGTGKAVTKLVGCHAHYVFGGSNTKGNVREGTSILMPDKKAYEDEGYNCCPERDVREIYGAGNEAEQDGNVTLILGCVHNMKNVYGGARKANVKGGIDLVVTSGSFEGVFGGNDLSGTIQGPITLTIEETGCDPLEIDNLYLGGNQAAYSVYGYKNTGTEDAPVLVARTKAEYDELTAEQKAAEGLPYADPVLNVVSCTRIGKTSGEDLGGAFGGGLGNGAVMYGSPTVNINMIPGKYAKDIDRDGTSGADNNANALGTITNVYGGGKEANVEGNTAVNINTVEKKAHRTNMGAEIPVGDRVQKDVLPAIITNNVFGAGKGLADNVNSALVTGNTTITMGGGSVAKSVYGGGQLSQVGGNTNITVSGGTIGTSNEGGATYGNIYGGGFGHNANVRFGLVKGNTNVTVTGGNVLHSVYGGGAYGSVGTYTYASNDANAAISNRPDNNTGKATIHITGGTIGTDGHENGMVFGSSRGDIAAPDAIQDNMAWVYDTEVVIGTENDETSGPTIHGSLYGSGENGHTFRNASVTMYSGTVGNPAEFYAYRGNVYGGGCGTDKYYADPAQETHDGHGTLFNPKAGIVKGNASVEILGGSVANNIYGAGAMGKVEGSTSVVINTEGSVGVDGDHDDGNVYGAARGELGLSNDYASVTNSSVTITKGTVKGSVYGGGRAGVVTGAVTVALNGGTVNHDVYGGGALAQTNTLYDGDNETYKTYKTNVNLAGTTVNGNLYGGGLGRLASAGSAAVPYADVNEYNAAKGTSLTAEQFAALSDAEKTKTPAVAAQAAVAANVNGPVMVSVTSGPVTNVFGCNNLNGAPQTTVDVEIGAKTGEAPSITYTGSATVSGSVYGGGNMAAYTGSPAVKIYSGTVNTNVYGGGLGATAVTGGTSVTMEGGTVDNDVYGGGSQADVTGSVAVTIAGGTVTHDVYGGGALANTNTANWDPEKENIFYDEVSFLKVGESVVTGLYTKPAEEYVKVTEENTKAANGVTYYRQIKGGWASDTNTSTTYTTTVTLTGGIMGNAYGGGLGDVDTPVYIFGNVTVKLNEGVSDPTKGAAFTRETATNITVGGKNYPAIPLTGSIFGCNNINGTPRGDVMVEVFSTRQLNNAGTAIVSGHSPNGSNENYEVQAVYGGGNQADYQPLATKKTQVVIRGCDETSIEKVYGGGNSAAVPATDVTIWGTYDISDAFGGGNGSLPIRRDGVWIENAGSKVYGNTNVVCKGGKIGNVFGGSDAKGNVYGTMHTDVEHPEGSCALKITKIYGASKEADVDGDVNVIINGCSSDAIEYVCGGSYNANIRGDITLTITSGIFKNVYGGNDARGSIGGNITVNIQEEDNCKPIIIQNLVGGGFAADYPGLDTKKGGNAKRIKRDGDGKYITGEYTDFTSGKITVNVKSATRIDNIYGGGFRADVNGDTEVNINMIKGLWAGAQAPEGYSSLPNVHTKEYAKVLGLEVGTSSVTAYYEKSGDVYTKTSDVTAVSGKTYYAKVDTYVIDDAIGTIGNVYGGGNEGNVYGDAVVNIGTETEIPIMYRDGSGTFVTHKDVNNVQVIDTQNSTVLGAHITGNVFGGGNQAYVRDDATVNICAKKNGSGVYEAVSEGSEGVSIAESVYGGGNAADIRGNTNVTMSGGYVFDGVYGGGLHGSVGTAAVDGDGKVLDGAIVYHTGTEAHAGCIGKIVNYKANTGKCTVVISGGQVGPVDVATAEGGMTKTGGPVDVGFVFGAGRGEVEDPATDKDADFRTFVKETDVTISGTAFIMASVYGGGENGRVFNDTYVKIQGGQIGCGKGSVSAGKPVPYNDSQFIDPTTTAVTAIAGCSSWTFDKNDYKSYDPLATLPYGDGTEVTDASTTATDGNTYYGSVFGGGSGYYPYESHNGTRHDWLRSAGQVFGNTNITISGGHILNSVYGGNETTDVGTYEDNDDGFPIKHVSGGKSTITMTGGTVGVPRTTDQIEALPVSGSLFGAGKGDHRTYFNTWTNVQEVEVNISGGIIYGSVFGGGEEGHVLGNVDIDISGTAVIGTHGTTSYEGNVFGGGRGFSGMALTAGSTGGNVTMRITGGTMLGNVYGGGRLASVGIGFTPPSDKNYGQLIDDTDEDEDGTIEDSERHGHVTIDISGGTIGKTTANETVTHPVGGNVYGGSMGRITYLDDTRNPLWPKQAVTKLSEVNISGGTIYNSVYGGSEIGVVRNFAEVNVSGGTIHGNVFGGGYGSDDQDKWTITAGGYDDIPSIHYTFTPMMWTGCVAGDTEVNISGGTIKKSVYGGGNYASVGLMNFNSSEDGTTYNYITKHNTTDGFGLSWPYEFQYIQAAPKDNAPGGKAIGGKTTITITGGRIGTTVDTDNAGFVYGGSKGQVSFKKADNTTPITNIDEQVEAEAFCANVRETEINIEYASTPESDNGSTTPCIVRTVYGGGEDGHVMENAVVNLKQGWIGRTLFGGGKGASTYKGTKYVYNGSSWTLTDDQDIHSWTAGKVYGNTTVTITGGKVGWFVYGGGNMASVGKGNYAGGADDYSTAGYGEKIAGNLWTSAYNPEAAISESNKPDDAYYFLNSGKTTVNLFGGTIGIAGFNDDGIPYGSVFGGSRGTAAIETNDVMSLSPLYKYLPDFYCGYVNKTVINVGGTTENGAVDGAGPTIYGSIYGGAQDGHVRNSTEVKMFKGSVAGQTSDANGRSGHVFGAGSGIGTYVDKNDGDKNKINSSSGSVTCTTLVELNGGSIAGNIYGGGAMASVGPPKIGDKNEQHAASDSHKSFSKTQVDIKDGTVGGNVYGASRGPGDAYYESQFTAQSLTYDKTKFATDIWSDVTVSGGTIGNNVYGGGQGGIVKESTTVSLTGGSIAHNAYGGGQGTKYLAADIFGNTTTELNKGKGASDSGCMVEKVFGCNDLKGTPKGHVLVHVYATQHKNKTQIVPEGGKYAKFESMEGGYSITNYSGLTTLAEATGTDVSAYTAVLSGEGTEDEKKTALANMIEAIADKKYDVLAVYGGGDLAMYEPTDPNEATDVIIDGCALTSIKQVYGGGNAASTPANLVRINEAYEIHEAFGGGNGKDAYEKGGKWYENLGANVGYYATYHSDTSGNEKGTQGNPYPAVANEDADTPEERRANTSYHYGKGTANLIITGGRVHTTYGGSNTKGNVRAEVHTSTEDAGVCDLLIDKSYPAGKNADTDAGSKVEAKCVDYQGAIYGGAENANVYSDVVIDVTNGTYGAIYGGNDRSGQIYGSVTINVHEEGCKPIVIGKLYAGGYNADYSIYGYYQDAEDGNKWKARTKAQYDALSESEKEQVTVQRDPQINIISATRIGKIYGGGYQAKLIGNPSVNVNMEKGFIATKYASDAKFNPGKHSVTEHDMDCSYEVEKREDGKAILAIGTIGTIYGGGYKGDVQGDTRVEIGTGEWLNFTSKRETTDADGKVYTYNSETTKWDWTKTVDETTTSGTVDDKPVPARNAATILGNVFGGGEGEAKESGDRAFYCESAMVGIDGDGVDHPEGGTSVIIANGTVGTLDNEDKLVAGTGNVYGGGEIGRVEKNTVVTIGVTPKEGETIEDTKFKPTVYGSVFGAGKGVDTHGFSALVMGNSTVTIQGFAKVGESVYGGGEVASVGRYDLDSDGMPTSLVSETSGNCIVTVLDNAEIGPDNMTMFHVDGSGNIVADDQPDNSGHVFGAGKGAMPGDYTFSGTSYPYHMKLDDSGNSVWESITTEKDYLKFIESLGLATQTEVTIGGNAFVKGDVFGGAEQGFVQHDTHVTIEGDCQIGNGYAQMADDGTYLNKLTSPVNHIAINRRYSAAEWEAGHLITVDSDPDALKTLAATHYTSSLPECASWLYGQATGDAKYASHDIYAGATGYDSKGGSKIADNGSTFYGNVFGGGSGYFPYKAGTWHWKAGDVGGNTVVDIKGGHILTNVYGANELTNVTGKSTINMSGGTIGVPRTLGQIVAHPVTCYLFGGGKGDPRVLFNKQTNVNDVEVNISGGWIYGSAFGGGEDGHVMRNVTMNIQNTVDNTDPENPVTISPKIGTWGTSYVDGNVFGGGRGFAADAYTAGNVAGSVTLNISGGTMLGSVYGGGRLGSVGYGLYDEKTPGGEPTPGYGEMREDHKMDNGDADGGFFTKGRGHVEINISGGTIGNELEYKNVTADGTYASLVAAQTALATWKNNNYVSKTDYETIDNGDGTYTNRLFHTKGGNVYAGGMGRREQLDGTSVITAVDWHKLGNVKSTKLTITGGTIKSNVYGGGEYGAVQGTHTTSEKQWGTEINITGGTIGTEIVDETVEGETKPVMYTYGSVFGGGTGTIVDVQDNVSTPVSNVNKLSAYVANNAKVAVTDAIVRGSVYGGGELGAVGGNTDVTISGTTEIGRNEVKPATDANAGYVMFGGWRMGNVYGGGRGSEQSTIAGLVKGNTNVTISGGNVYHNVYGGGALASVGDFEISTGSAPSYIPIAGVPYNWKYTDGAVIDPANPDPLKTPTGTATVTITGGTIGISGRDNGLVFGSSRGDLQKPVDEDPGEGEKLVDPYDRVAWVNKSVVTIGTSGSGTTLNTPLVKGSVYGGGENGHNDESATVNVYSGTIGVTDTDDPWYSFTDKDLEKDVQLYRGNVYGAGSGSDTYTGDDSKQHYNPKSGMVGGNTFVNIAGGHVGRAVYGGGAMASVGTITSSTPHESIENGFGLSWPYAFEFADGTGKATVNVTGGHIGTRQLEGGDVYGSSRGVAGDRYDMANLALTNETEVNIRYGKPGIDQRDGGEHQLSYDH